MSEIKQILETAEASVFVSLNELRKQNVMIDGKRTSVTLEPQIWGILKEVAKDQGSTVHELCSFISNRKAEGSSLASSIRVFLISYLNIQLKKRGP